MLHCDDCGARFTETRRSRVYWGECHGRPVYACTCVCPVCGGAPQELPEEEDEEHCRLQARLSL